MHHFCQENLERLRHLKMGYALRVDKYGRLIEVKHRPLFWKARIATILLRTIQSFFAYRHTPLFRKDRGALLLRKKVIMEEIVQHLQRAGVDTKAIKEEWDHYQRLLIVQGSIIEEIRWRASKAKISKNVRLVKEGFKQGVLPILTFHGFSGTYIMRSASYEPLGIFKPFDEEVGGPNNPAYVLVRGPLGRETIRKGILVGECCHREVSASVIDEILGFDLVPRTIYARFEGRFFGGLLPSLRERLGSFQEYRKGFSPLTKWPKEMAYQIPTDMIHSLFILDLILGHLDRHWINILFDGHRILAIDNGLCLSRCKYDMSNWQGRDFLQMRTPLSESKIGLIRSLDAGDLSLRIRKRASISLLVLEQMEERVRRLQEGVMRGYLPLELCDWCSAC